MSQYDITELKRMLNSRALAVAEHLLPGGKRDGSEYRSGSVSGGQGESLGVHLSGAKAGIWSDFNTGEKGDLIDLWMASKGGDIAAALASVRSWLGVIRPHPYREPERTYTRPAKPKCVAAAGVVRDYLTENRNIPGHILELYKVAAQGDDIVFPFLLPDGVLAMAKTRKAEDGAKPKPTAKDCEPILFGWQAIPVDAREVVLTEGEIDALSWAAYGHPAMSVPFGGGKGAKQQWIEREFERMERFERIYISTDMDKAGEEAADEIAHRLGRHRCMRVELPRKDANECLVEGVPKPEMDACIENAKGLDPVELHRPSEYANAVSHLFWPAPEEHVGYHVPYEPLDRKLLFRPGELTLWSGAAGVGKSQILLDCAVDWVRQGSKTCLSSLEMNGAQTLKRMVKQVTATDRPTDQFIRVALTWLDTGLLLYDRVGKADVTALLGVFEYSRAKYGCDQFIIDSLMRLGIVGDDYTGQERVIYELIEWTARNKVHTHLVAHARKSGDRDRGSPETEDIKGAMELGANAFNILTVWRNRKREAEIAEAATDEGKVRATFGGTGPVVLNVAKQRNGDFEGKVSLWFDQESNRYRSTPEMTSRVYVSMATQQAGA